MTINAILNSISQQRFSTYQTAVFKGATDEECLGIYLWNKQLASAFLPALQILEVSLRNAIYQAKIEYEEDDIERKYPAHEWVARKAAIDRDWFITVMTAANNFESNRQINTARKNITSERKSHTPENYIAKLTLGFWVSLVGKDFSIPNATYLTLWPHLRGRVFPHAVDMNGQPLSIKTIGNALHDVNKIRNRLSHHEPLWRSGNTYNIEQAINKVATDYKKCLDVIRWINPSNLKLLNIIDNTDKVRELCNTHALWKNKQLPNGIPTLPLTDSNDWCNPLLMNSRLDGVITKINLKGKFAIVHCASEGKDFCAQTSSFSGGIASYQVSDVVSFEPSSNITRGQPTASTIRR
ncbi:Abi family protein [Pantoea ananatis]|uniref:Abi family protein n=1 Tax=Pantoea ananas TaxID=553 RepID=UPI000B7D8C59|nr:Abi family protein [Pantoea ananatis]